VNEVERAFFGERAPTWGNPLLESAAARILIKPEMGPFSGTVGLEKGIPPFAFSDLYVTTTSVARAQRLHIPPLTALSPIRCSTVLLVATHH
jgi:hypothetical protein